MNEQVSDEAAVARVLGGDVESFGILMKRYRDRYFRFAYHLLGNREDAEDVLQEAFLRAYRSLRTCSDPTHFGSWLYTILINQCRTTGARRGARDRGNTGDLLLDSIPGEKNEMEGVEWREEVERALAKLPLEQREAFLLKHIEDLSYDEMAERTGDNVSALKMRVMRACEGLRIQLRGIET